MKAIIYTSVSCTICHLVMDYLTEKGVEIEERSTRNSIFKRELIQMGYMGVPLIIINGEEIYGFHKEKIDKALGL